MSTFCFCVVDSVSDFANSFGSGMALCALVHAYDNTLIDYNQLDPSRHLDNLALGMALAEQVRALAGLLCVVCARMLSKPRCAVFGGAAHDGAW